MQTCLNTVGFAATSAAFVRAPSPSDLANREARDEHADAMGRVFRAGLPKQHALIIHGMRLIRSSLASHFKQCRESK